MRPNRRVAAVAVLLIAAPAGSVRAAAPGELDELRRECIAAAGDMQRREQAFAALERAIELHGRDAEARRRGLDETRPEQARLLGTLLHLARNPPDPRAVYFDDPVEQVRSELLMQAAEPALRAQARALSGELARIADLRLQIVAKQAELGGTWQAIASERERLAALTTRRLELTRQLLTEDAALAVRAARIARDAKDLDELIRVADAASDRRDRDLLARRSTQARKASPPAPEIADPTRPRDLQDFDPPQSAVVAPVAGKRVRGLGDAEGPGGTIGGIRLAALARASVVAPFDGKVVYAGSFRDFGVVLIIRHGGGYHSLSAGLDWVDVSLDHWVLAGEPVGAMPDGAGGTLYFELRRDGRPVDPQPWLASVDDGRPVERPTEHDQSNGDQRVRQ